MSLRAERHPTSPHAEEGWPCLIVVRDGTHYALSADIVRGFGAVPSGAPQSDLLAHFPGVPVDGGPGRAVLCGVGSKEHVLLVDDVLGLTQVPKSDIKPLPAHFAGPERLWFSGIFVFQETVAVVLNADWLLMAAAQPGLPEAANGDALGPVDGTEIDLENLGLEEASDAEETPWAEL